MELEILELLELELLELLEILELLLELLELLLERVLERRPPPTSESVEEVVVD